jgi:hypothetical protein
MAWTEQHGDRFRVRYRHASRLVTDGTYDTADAACARVRRLDHLSRPVRLRLAAPPPTLVEWTTTWLPAHLAGRATIAKYESMLRGHILPAFGGQRLDAITRNDAKAFARALTNDRAPVNVAASSACSGSSCALCAAGAFGHGRQNGQEQAGLAVEVVGIESELPT